MAKELLRWQKGDMAIEKSNFKVLKPKLNDNFPQCVVVDLNFTLNSWVLKVNANDRRSGTFMMQFDP